MFSVSSSIPEHNTTAPPNRADGIYLFIANACIHVGAIRKAARDQVLSPARGVIGERLSNTGEGAQNRGGGGGREALARRGLVTGGS